MLLFHSYMRLIRLGLRWIWVATNCHSHLVCFNPTWMIVPICDWLSRAIVLAQSWDWATGIPSLPFVEAHLVELDITTDECGVLGSIAPGAVGPFHWGRSNWGLPASASMACRSVALRFVHLKLPMGNASCCKQCIMILKYFPVCFLIIVVVVLLVLLVVIVIIPWSF